MMSSTCKEDRSSSSSLRSTRTDLGLGLVRLLILVILVGQATQVGARNVPSGQIFMAVTDEVVVYLPTKEVDATAFTALPVSSSCKPASRLSNPHPCNDTQPFVPILQVQDIIRNLNDTATDKEQAECSSLSIDVSTTRGLDMIFCLEFLTLLARLF